MEQFVPYPESKLESFSKEVIPHPNRGTKYSKAEFDDIRYRKAVYSNDFRIDKEALPFADYWKEQIIKWQDQTIKAIGWPLAGKYFRGGYTDRWSESWMNYGNIHDLNKAHPRSYLAEKVNWRRETGDNAFFCKYGTCKYSDVNNRTYNNIFADYLNNLKILNADIINYLNILTPKFLLGEIPIREFAKYVTDADAGGNKHTYIPDILIAEVLKEKYGIKVDNYYRWKEDLDNYLKGIKDTEVIVGTGAGTVDPQTMADAYIPNLPVKKGGYTEAEITEHKEQYLQQKKEINLDPKLGGKGFIKVGYREDIFKKTPHLLGRERVILLANGEMHRSIFALVELDAIFPSHNPYTFASTEGYPTNERGENVNDRNYTDDKNAQANVIRVAQNFEPEIQVTTSATAAGLPIITIDGIVVSGNNRIMSFKRMVQDFPDNYTRYMQVLARELYTFGFDNVVASQLLMGNNIALAGSSFYNPLSIKFKNPVLVRIDLDFPEYTTTELSKYNKDTKKSERPIDKAIKMSSMLLDNKGCFNNITAIVGEYDTFTDLYANTSDVKRLENQLLECNIITKNEIAQYLAGGTFNAAGKELIENLLAGMILDKESLIASEIAGVKILKQRLIVALPVLIKNGQYKEDSLIPNVRQAIMLQAEIQASGLSFGEFLGQFSMFERPVYTYETYIINRLINKSQKVFKRSLESYNAAIDNNLGESLFGDKPTVGEIFNTTIASQIEQSEIDIIKKSIHLLSEPKSEPVIDKKKSLPTRLRGLELALKFAKSEDEKVKIQKRIKGLTIALKLHD